MSNSIVLGANPIVPTDNVSILFSFQVSKFIKDQEKMAGMDESDDQAHNEMIADIFRNEDKDKDGLISHEEFSGPKHDEL